MTVADTATKLTSSPTDSLSGQSVLVKNKTGAAASVFIDRADTLTTATGYELEAGESVGVDLQSGEALWGIVASGTIVVHVLEAGI